MNDLSLTPTSEILEELSKRYDSVIFGYASAHDKHVDEIKLSYYGGAVMALGLTHLLKHKILNHLEETDLNDD